MINQNRLHTHWDKLTDHEKRERMLECFNEMSDQSCMIDGLKSAVKSYEREMAKMRKHYDTEIWQLQKEISKLKGEG